MCGKEQDNGRGESLEKASWWDPKEGGKVGHSPWYKRGTQHVGVNEGDLVDFDENISPFLAGDFSCSSSSKARISGKV